MNGDTVMDLAVAAKNGSNSVAVLLGLGDGGFSSATSYNTFTSLPVAIATGDFDSDGKIDIALASANNSNSVAILTNRGSGTFMYFSGHNLGANATALVAVDLNYDGKLDSRGHRLGEQHGERDAGARRRHLRRAGQLLGARRPRGARVRRPER